MPKITVKGGASHEAPPENLTASEVESSPGTSSSASDESKPTHSETSSDESPEPARTTGSHSKKGRTGSSSVRSTGTAGRNKGS